MDLYVWMIVILIQVNKIKLSMFFYFKNIIGTFQDASVPTNKICKLCSNAMPGCVICLS